MKALQQREPRLRVLVKQRTAELVEARDQAEAANRAKSAFLANMSHELRTPLNAILGYANLLHDRSASADQRQDLEAIHRSGEHLLGLINDVLDVAKVEAGRTVLQCAPCDLKALVRDVTDMMRMRATEKDLTLILERAPDVPQWIKTDAAKLRQVLINLVSNAIKFTERGSVALRAGVKPEDDPRHVRLSFEVADTGTGIAPEDQVRIFEAFVQTGVHQRTGLGFTITRQFVELMGGSITLDSALGAGPVFRVELPVELEPENEPEAPKLGRVLGLEPGQPEYRVLVVDDDSDCRRVLQRLLENAGFKVQVASGAAATVEVCRSWRPHFIWMDLQMPGGDGMQATREIRSLEGGSDVKIASVTASVFAHQ